MNRLRARLAARDERGVSTLFVVLFAVALLVCAGLVIDGGYALAAKQSAMTAAEQAARAGSDALNQADLRSGVVSVDPGRAYAAANAYLTSAGDTGTVSINGGVVTVSVTIHQKTAILSLVGVRDISVTATSSATSIDSQTP